MRTNGVPDFKVSWGAFGSKYEGLVERFNRMYISGKFAKDAAAGKKQFLVTHSEIYPGTFASTTHCPPTSISSTGFTYTSAPKTSAVLATYLL